MTTEQQKFAIGLLAKDFLSKEEDDLLTAKAREARPTDVFFDRKRGKHHRKIQKAEGDNAAAEKQWCDIKEEKQLSEGRKAVLPPDVFFDENTLKPFRYVQKYSDQREETLAVEMKKIELQQNIIKELGEQKEKIDSINGKLTFFVVLTIISLILGFLGIFNF